MNDNNTTNYIIPDTSSLIKMLWIIRDLEDLMGDNKSQYDFELILKLVDLDQEFHSLFEQWAEGQITEEEYNNKFDKLEERVREIVKHFSLFYYVQTDPRGLSLYISKIELDQTNYNSTRSNSMAVGRLVFNLEDFKTLI